MKIEYLHASKFGNGAMVAAEFARLMAGKGVAVEVHHIRELNPTEVPPADLRVQLARPDGQADRANAALPPQAEPRGRCQVRPPHDGDGPKPGQADRACRPRSWPGGSGCPIMNEILQAKGLVKVGEDKVYVTAMKGPLEEGWEQKVWVVATLPIVEATA